MAWRRRANKFGAVPTVADGIKFPSKLEAAEYLKLKAREQAGEISDLRLQVPYALNYEGKLICKYIADFVFIEDGMEIIADAKGVRTAAYQLKKKLMWLILGIRIRELVAPRRKKAAKTKAVKCSTPDEDDPSWLL